MVSWPEQARPWAQMYEPLAAALGTEVHLAAVLVDGHFYTLCLERRGEAVLKEFLWPQARCVGHVEAGQFCNKSTVCEEEMATAVDRSLACEEEMAIAFDWSLA